SVSPSFSFRRAARRIFSHEIFILNNMLSGLDTDEQREFFWDEELPYLYGHLRGLYGDQDGLRKMGYSDCLYKIGEKRKYVLPVRTNGTIRFLGNEQKRLRRQFRLRGIDFAECVAADNFS